MFVCSFSYHFFAFFQYCVLSLFCHGTHYKIFLGCFVVNQRIVTLPDWVSLRKEKNFSIEVSKIPITHKRGKTNNALNSFHVRTFTQKNECVKRPVLMLPTWTVNGFPPRVTLLEEDFRVSILYWPKNLRYQIRVVPRLRMILYYTYISTF